MLHGLVVLVVGNRDQVVCPKHSTEELWKGSISNSKGVTKVFWKCSVCENSGEWLSDAERETETRDLANKASSRK